MRQFRLEARDGHCSAPALDQRTSGSDISSLSQQLSGICGDYGNPDRKSTRLNSSHTVISYAVFCLKKKITCVRRRGTAPVTWRANDAAPPVCDLTRLRMTAPAHSP